MIPRPTLFSSTSARALLTTALLAGVCPTQPTARSAAGSTFYVAPNGDDAGPGSLQRPWATVARAVTALRAGDTLLLRGGTYHERYIDIAVAGTADRWITIGAYPGERARIDGGIAEFRAPGNSDWELVDAAKQIYRSKRSFPNAKPIYGYFGPVDRQHRLVTYESYAPFSTDNETYLDVPPYYYVGPGLFWNPLDARIYLRTARTGLQGRLALPFPLASDPASMRIVLFESAPILDFQAGAAHVQVQDLDLLHAGSPARIGTGAHDIAVRRCTLRGGRYHVTIRDGARAVVLEDLAIEDAVPAWITWTDVKLPPVGRPAHLLQGAAVWIGDRVDDVEIARCQVRAVFDGITATQRVTNLRVHHCRFDEIRDDVLQIGTAGEGLEFAYNVATRCYSGVSRHGNGAPSATARETKFIHHNVIETATAQMVSRDDPRRLLPAKLRGPAGNGLGSGRPFGRHRLSSITGPDPWKIYHNTLIGTQDIDAGGLGVTYDLVPFDPAAPQEVFNNIFVQVADYHLVRDARTADGSMVMDGNLYYRVPATPAQPLLRRYANGTATRHFRTLEEFLGSAHWRASQAYYPPGWEASGAHGAPLLDALFRPKAGSPAAAGAVALAGRPWPGLAGETFRGALPPLP